MTNPTPKAVPADTPNCEQRITAYLGSGGLWNPELAIHDAVRDLLIDCRSELAAANARIEAWTLQTAWRR